MNEFTNWLTLNQLEKYADILQQNDITSVDLLIELSEDEIKELGFSLGDRKRFAIAKKSTLSQQDLELINSLPYVIAYPLKRWDVSFIKVLTKNKSATLITQSE